MCLPFSIFSANAKAKVFCFCTVTHCALIGSWRIVYHHLPGTKSVVSCFVCAVSLQSARGLRCHIDLKTTAEAEGKLLDTKLIPFRFSTLNSFTHHCSSFLSSFVPRGHSEVENKAKIWWKSEMKRPVVTSRGREADSSWGEDKPSYWKGKHGCFSVLVIHWCENAFWHPFITVYLGIRIVRRKSRIWIH